MTAFEVRNGEAVPRYWLGVDLAQSSDYTAVAILEGRVQLLPAATPLEASEIAAGIREAPWEWHYETR